MVYLYSTIIILNYLPSYDRSHEYLQNGFPSEIWVFALHGKLNLQNSKIGISNLKQRVLGGATVQEEEVTRSLNTDAS